MNELISAFRPEKTAPKLNKEIKILDGSEYKSESTLAHLIKSIHQAPIEWNELGKEFLKRKKYEYSDQQLPGVFLELHIDRILNELGTRNTNIINKPIPDGFSTEKFVFKKRNGLGQLAAHSIATDYARREYDNLVAVRDKQGDKYLIVIEAKSGNPGEAITEEHRNKLFKPLIGYCKTTPESEISGLGYILVITNKRDSTNSKVDKTVSIKYNNIGALVSISESRENFVTGALKAGKTMR